MGVYDYANNSSLVKVDFVKTIFDISSPLKKILKHRIKLMKSNREKIKNVLKIEYH